MILQQVCCTGYRNCLRNGVLEGILALALTYDSYGPRVENILVAPCCGVVGNDNSPDDRPLLLHGRQAMAVFRIPMVVVVDSAIRWSESGDELGGCMAQPKVCATSDGRRELVLVSVSDRALVFESSEPVKSLANGSSSVLCASYGCAVKTGNNRCADGKVLGGFQLERCDPPRYSQVA